MFKHLFKNSGLITGAIIGTLFALVFAPQKGKMVRERMKKAYDEGDNALYPLKKGYIALFREVLRKGNVFLKEEEKEKNPFDINEIRHRV